MWKWKWMLFKVNDFEPYTTQSIQAKQKLVQMWGLVCTWPSPDISWLEGSLFKEDFHSSHCCFGLAFKNFNSTRKGELFSDEYAFTFTYLLKEDSQMIQSCSQAAWNPKSLQKGSFSSEVIVLTNFVGFCWIWYRDSHCLKRPRWEFVTSLRVVIIELVCRSL